LGLLASSSEEEGEEEELYEVEDLGGASGII